MFHFVQQLEIVHILIDIFHDCSILAVDDVDLAERVGNVSFTVSLVDLEVGDLALGVAFREDVCVEGL